MAVTDPAVRAPAPEPGDHRTRPEPGAHRTRPGAAKPATSGSTAAKPATSGSTAAKPPTSGSTAAKPATSGSTAPKSAVPASAASDSAASGPGRSARRRPSPAARVLGVVGELLISAGAVLGLYVVWQVGWTSVEAGRESAAALSAIEEQMPPPVVEPAPAAQVFGPDVAPPVVAPDANGALGVLHVPVWGEDYAAPILQGTTDAVLATGGAGHYEETALPGEIGNASLAGHRLTRGNPFLRVDELHPGDPVVVETAGAWLVYEVVSDRIVDPYQVDVIWPVPSQADAVPTERLLTLTTCHPVTSRSHRWITHLTLSHWTPRNAGVPPELAGSVQAPSVALEGTAG